MREITVCEGLTEDIIRGVLERNLYKFDHCYGQAEKRSSDLIKGIKFKIVIGPTGQVVKAHKDGSETPESGFEQCLARTLMNLSFQPPKTQKEVVATVVFVLN